MSTGHLFQKGDKVLCFEPDEKKAKVLYAAKIVGISETKCRWTLQKIIQYKVHFQGWNNSWDRKVTEESLLLDTPENRELQQELEIQAQLQYGRRERKPPSNNTIANNTSVTVKPRKRKAPPGKRFDDTGGVGGVGASASAGSGVGAVGAEPISSNIPPSTHPSVATSEDCFASAGTTGKNKNYSTNTEAGGSGTPTASTGGEASAEPSVEPMISEDLRVRLQCSDRLRQYLEYDRDMVLKHKQKHKLPSRLPIIAILENFVKQSALKLVFSEAQPIDVSRDVGRRRAVQRHVKDKQDKDFQKLVTYVCMLKEVADGLRIYFDFVLAEYLLYEEERDYVLRFLCRENMRKYMCTTAAMPESHYENYTPRPQTPQPPEEPLTLKEKQQEELAYCTDDYDRMIANCLQSLNSDMTNAQPFCFGAEGFDVNYLISLHPKAVCIPEKTKEFLEDVLSWRILPPSAPPAPSMMFGAPHLARLLVKLPHFLSASDLTAEKLKVLVQYLDSFTNFLEARREWFNEDNYVRQKKGGVTSVQHKNFNYSDIRQMKQKLQAERERREQLRKEKREEKIQARRLERKLERKRERKLQRKQQKQQQKQQRKEQEREERRQQRRLQRKQQKQQQQQEELQQQDEQPCTSAQAERQRNQRAKQLKRRKRRLRLEKQQEPEHDEVAHANIPNLEEVPVQLEEEQQQNPQQDDQQQIPQQDEQQQNPQQDDEQQIPQQDEEQQIPQEEEEQQQQQMNQQNAEQNEKDPLRLQEQKEQDNEEQSCISAQLKKLKHKKLYVRLEKLKEPCTSAQAYRFNHKKLAVRLEKQQEQENEAQPCTSAQEPKLNNKSPAVRLEDPQEQEEQPSTSAQALELKNNLAVRLEEQHEQEQEEQHEQEQEEQPHTSAQAGTELNNKNLAERLEDPKEPEKQPRTSSQAYEFSPKKRALRLSEQQLPDNEVQPCFSIQTPSSEHKKRVVTIEVQQAAKHEERPTTNAPAYEYSPKKRALRLSELQLQNYEEQPCTSAQAYIFNNKSRLVRLGQEEQGEQEQEKQEQEKQEQGEQEQGEQEQEKQEQEEQPCTSAQAHRLNHKNLAVTLEEHQVHGHEQQLTSAQVQRLGPKKRALRLEEQQQDGQPCTSTEAHRFISPKKRALRLSEQQLLQEYEEEPCTSAEAQRLNYKKCALSLEEQHEQEYEEQPCTSAQALRFNHKKLAVRLEQQKRQQEREEQPYNSPQAHRFNPKKRAVRLEVQKALELQERSRTNSPSYRLGPKKRALRLEQQLHEDQSCTSAQVYKMKRGKRSVRIEDQQDQEDQVTEGLQEQLGEREQQTEELPSTSSCSQIFNQGKDPVALEETHYEAHQERAYCDSQEYKFKSGKRSGQLEENQELVDDPCSNTQSHSFNDREVSAGLQQQQLEQYEENKNYGEVLEGSQQQEQEQGSTRLKDFNPRDVSLELQQEQQLEVQYKEQSIPYSGFKYGHNSVRLEEQQGQHQLDQPYINTHPLRFNHRDDSVREQQQQRLEQPNIGNRPQGFDSGGVHLGYQQEEIRERPLQERGKSHSPPCELQRQKKQHQYDEQKGQETQYKELQTAEENECFMQQRQELEHGYENQRREENLPQHRREDREPQKIRMMYGKPHHSHHIKQGELLHQPHMEGPYIHRKHHYYEHAFHPLSHQNHHYQQKHHEPYYQQYYPTPTPPHHSSLPPHHYPPHHHTQQQYHPHYHPVSPYQPPKRSTLLHPYPNIKKMQYTTPYVMVPDEANWGMENQSPFDLDLQHLKQNEEQPDITEKSIETSNPATNFHRTETITSMPS